MEVYLKKDFLQYTGRGGDVGMLSVPFFTPLPRSTIRLDLHVQFCTPLLVKVKPLDGYKMTEKLSLKLRQLLTTGRKLLLIMLYHMWTSSAWHVAVCGEVTDEDIDAGVFNKNIQAEDRASSDEEENSSVTQERPIPSADEAMDYIH
uniref:Uncharacterized protein n=1 Tax=Timema poppense TaxID=170557 RepID=A0A7R9DPG5_TIMPO|nr:unnamed protein product [Timema poppensis]